MTQGRPLSLFAWLRVTATVHSCSCADGRTSKTVNTTAPTLASVAVFALVSSSYTNTSDWFITGELPLSVAIGARKRETVRRDGTAPEYERKNDTASISHFR